MKHSITVRPACATDEPFLFDVFCSVQKDQFASLEIPPDEKEQLMRIQFQAQQQQYRGQCPNADFDLVLNDGVPIGNFYALRGPDEFVLIDITLLPEHRNSGIGTMLVRDLILEAKSAEKPLLAHVQKQNPAWRLWHRLGFRLISDDGVYLAIEVPAGEFCKSKKKTDYIRSLHWT